MDKIGIKLAEIELNVELTPQMQQRLAKQAKQRGQDEIGYVRTLILEGLGPLFAHQEEPKKPHRSITELHGLGVELWNDKKGSLIDA